MIEWKDVDKASPDFLQQGYVNGVHRFNVTTYWGGRGSFVIDLKTDGEFIVTRVSDKDDIELAKEKATEILKAESGD